MSVMKNNNMLDKNNTVNFDVQFTDISIIQNVLSGEFLPSELWRAFWFDLTEEGFDYWDRERSKEILSAHARKKLFNMIKKR